MFSTLNSLQPATGVRPVASKQAGLAPVLKAKARSADPLPTFPDAETYKNFVIKLVGQTRSAEQDLLAARKALNELKGTQGSVDMAQERVDGLKLQLAVLRDNYTIPPEWTRPRWSGGQGFDLPSFWRQQVEGLPGKPVVVAPAPVPAPVRPATGAAAPSRPNVDARWEWEKATRLAHEAKDTMAAGENRDQAVFHHLAHAIEFAKPDECIAVMQYGQELLNSGSLNRSLQAMAINHGAENATSIQSITELVKAAQKYAHGGGVLTRGIENLGHAVSPVDKYWSSAAATNDMLVGVLLKRALEIAATSEDTQQLVALAQASIQQPAVRAEFIKSALAHDPNR